MADDDEYPTVEEQMAYSMTMDLVRDWVERKQLNSKELGMGILTAAVVCFSRGMEYEEIATILYERADGLATLHLED